MSASRARRLPRSLLLAGVGVALLAVGLLALGVWQLQRLAWKTDLIARVEARVHAAPVPAPSRGQWRDITRAKDEYRRVAIAGAFLHPLETQVHAVTDLGGGYWVLTPLRADDGTVTLVNRGFVPADRRSSDSRRAGQVEGRVSVTGLIRMTEPGGAFLRPNDPAGDRWYARDVEAIAAARGIEPADTAPYFIDVDASPAPGGYPRGGLTRIAFPNSHLAYALTWFAMAAIAIGMFVHFARQMLGPDD